MKLGLSCIDSAFSADPYGVLDLELVRHAEALGYDSVWVGEAYGSDAVTMATWLAAHTNRIRIGTAILQIPARTPAATAMTTIGLHHLSGGRFILGLGSSGPRVVEGWHSSAYHKPLGRTREYVHILRQILAGEVPVEHQGEHYQLPFEGENAMGLGKKMKSIAAGDPGQPIYLASISPGGIRCSADVGDGVLLSFLKPETAETSVGRYLDEGFALPGAHGGRDQFTVGTFVSAVMLDDVDAARSKLKQTLGMQLGGMGAKQKNFYAQFAARLGYADEVNRIQDLFLAGDRSAAVSAVPDALVDDIALVGPAGRIRERLQDWKSAEQRGQLDLMIVTSRQPETLELIAAEML